MRGLEGPVFPVGTMEQGVGGRVVEDAALDGIEVNGSIDEGGEIGDLEEFCEGSTDFEGGEGLSVGLDGIDPFLVVSGAAGQGFCGAAFEAVEFILGEEDVSSIPGAIRVEGAFGAYEEVAPSAHGVAEHPVFRGVFLGVEREGDRREGIAGGELDERPGGGGVAFLADF